MNDKPELVTAQNDLAGLVAELRTSAFVAVDTEFMRERTYWPRLCLVQVAGEMRAAAIDPLADDLDLEPLFDLMADETVLKVMHAGRQDMEIFYHLMERVPGPVFDTQVAAMVCGFGDQIAYDSLVHTLTGIRLEKVSRFSDWSERPLSERQLKYALADVTHLRTVYQKLETMLDETGRHSWVDEEHAILSSPDTYSFDPEEAWRRLKPRNDKPAFLAVLRAIAAWREREAQRRNLPRNRVLRDDVLTSIAANAPDDANALARIRGLPSGFAEGRWGRDLLAAIAEAKALPKSERPKLPARREVTPMAAAIADLLKVLLKFRSAEHGVASRLIASTQDLEAIALESEEADVPALHGWRRELFGEDALRVAAGHLGLALGDGRLRLIPVGDGGEADQSTTIRHS